MDEMIDALNMRNMKNDLDWIVFSQVNEWIKFADMKATALLAIGGVLGGLLVSSAPVSSSHGVRQILFIAAVISVVLSTLMSLFALLPRLGRSTELTSLIYFDHVARRFAGDRDRFVVAFAAAVEDAAAMRAEIAAQIWANSVVAQRKFRGLTYATWLVGAAMVLAGLTALIPHT